MSVEFKNPEVAAKYEALRSADGRVHIPAGKTGVGYAGPLSGITPEAAAKAVASGSNIIKEKEGAKTQPPKNEDAAAKNGSKKSKEEEPK